MLEDATDMDLKELSQNDFPKTHTEATEVSDDQQPLQTLPFDSPKSTITQKKCGDPRLQAHVVVFKRKRLSHLESTSLDSNIYENRLSAPDLDRRDRSKSRVSCVRCRKYKKKCTRDLPECCNCKTSEELCIYVPRKQSRKKEEPETPETELKGSEKATLPSINEVLGFELKQNLPGERLLPFGGPGVSMRTSLSDVAPMPTWPVDVALGAVEDGSGYCLKRNTENCVSGDSLSQKSCSRSYTLKRPHDLKSILN